MYIENPEDEQNQNQGSNSPSIGAGGGGASFGQGGTSTGNTGGNPSTIAPISSNQPTQKFANVQDYLKANQPQGEEFGQKFVSTIGEGVGQAKSAIDTSAQNTQGQIQSGTVNANPDLINEAVKTPTSITNDAEKMAEFQKEYNAQYTGPSSFESSDQYTPAITAATKAAQTGQELGTTGGREQLLQDVFGVYGQGNKGLDQAILQHSSTFPEVAPLAQNFQSVQDYLKAAAANTNTAAQNAAKITEATKAAATNAFANNPTNFQTGLNQRTATARNKLLELETPRLNETLNTRTILASGGFDPDKYESVIRQVASGDTSALQSYLNSPDWNYVERVQNSIRDKNSLAKLGVKPQDVLNPATAITNANVATPEDYANAAAYQKLTGVDYSGILNPADISQAGQGLNQEQMLSNALMEYLKQHKL